MIYVTIEPLDHQVIKPAKAKWLTQDKNKESVTLGCWATGSPRSDFGSGENRNVNDWNSSLGLNVITIPLQALVGTEQQNSGVGGRAGPGVAKCGKEGACHQALHRLRRSPALPHAHQCRTTHLWPSWSFQFSLKKQTKKHSIYLLSTNLRS